MRTLWASSTTVNPRKKSHENESHLARTPNPSNCRESLDQGGRRGGVGAGEVSGEGVECDKWQPHPR
jgi:hypothetical protein